MTTVGIIQDPVGGGGNAAVVHWYRDWVSRHQPDFIECRLDETRHTFHLSTYRHWPGDTVAMPRMLPKTHAAPYPAARYSLRRLWASVEAVQVAGAVSLHGWIAPSEIPKVVWMATTIRDERLSIAPKLDLKRRLLHGATLRTLERIESATLQSATRVLAMSPHTAHLLVRAGLPASKVSVVPIPIDVDTFKPAEGTRREGVLFVGRATDRRKGLDRVCRLLELSPTVRACGVDVVSSQRPAASVLSAPGIRWHGHVVNAVPHFQRARVFVLSSRQEGFGVAAFEALASGTPVVAFECGGPDAFLRESGGAIVAKSADEFRQSVERLILDEIASAEMGRAGRDWVVRQLDGAEFLANAGLFAAT